MVKRRTSRKKRLRRGRVRRRIPRRNKRTMKRLGRRIKHRSTYFFSYYVTDQDAIAPAANAVYGAEIQELVDILRASDKYAALENQLHVDHLVTMGTNGASRFSDLIRGAIIQKHMKMVYPGGDGVANYVTNISNPPVIDYVGISARVIGEARDGKHQVPLVLWKGSAVHPFTINAFPSKRIFMKCSKRTEQANTVPTVGVWPEVFNIFNFRLVKLKVYYRVKLKSGKYMPMRLNRLVRFPNAHPQLGNRDLYW